MSQRDHDDQDVAFKGFGGMPVPAPPTWVIDDDALSLNGAVARHFRTIGARHADALATQVIAAHRPAGLISSRRAAVDLGAALETFEMVLDEGVTDYAGGLTDQLADRAESLRTVMALVTSGHESDDDPQCSDAVADELDDLARAVSDRAGIPPPTGLDAFAMDEAHEQPDQQALADLAERIDAFSLVRGIPSLAGDATHQHGLRRDQLAARIGILATRHPVVLDRLSRDRAAIVGDLVPELAAVRAPALAVPPHPDLPTTMHLRELRRASTELIARLTQSAASAVHASSPIGFQVREQLWTRIADLHERRPDLTGELRPLHAGLVRHVAVTRPAHRRAGLDTGTCHGCRKRVPDQATGEHPPKPRGTTA